MSVSEERECANLQAVQDFEMVTVHSDHAGASLPLPEEVFPDRLKAASGGRGKRVRYAFITVAVLALFLALAIALPRSKKSNDSAAQFAGSNIARKSTFEDVVIYLVANGVSKAGDLEARETPQFFAAFWLAMQDERNLEVPFKHSLAEGHPRAYTFVFRYVMAVNYYSMGGPDKWRNTLDWFVKRNVCYWQGEVQGRHGPVKAGVFCENDQGAPTKLYLDFNALTGTIPTENGLLTSLTAIDMGSNDIVGEIPTELCALTALTHLSVATNAMKGQLPACIDTLTNLEILNVAGNFMTGSLPTALSTMTNLKRLILEENRFTGDPIPVFNALSNLEWILADRNKFRGQLDENFLLGHHSLAMLDLSSNNFTMDSILPRHLFSMRALTTLDLSSNNFDGHVPDDLLSTTVDNTRMRYLSLRNNKFNGGLPKYFERLVALEHLDVSSNGFHGPLHKELGNMTSLRTLFLSNNNWHAGAIPITLAGLTNLQDLALRNSNRNGALPTWLGSLPKLVLLDLGSNDYTGTIPTEYSALSSLEHLLLNQNVIAGSVPATMASLTNLKTLLLDATMLGGDLEFLCSPFPYQKLIYADCSGENPEVTCATCCKCRSSSSHLSSLDASWDAGFKRENYQLYVGDDV